MDNIKIGKFIKEQRIAKQLTQQQLADKLMVSNKAVSKWERGLNFPDITILEKLADALNISVNELLQGEKNKEETQIKKELNADVQKTMQYSDMKLKQQRKRSNHLFKIILVSILIGYVLIFVFGQVAFTSKEITTTITTNQIDDIFAKQYIDTLNTFEGMYVGDNVSISNLFDELPLSEIGKAYRIEDTHLIVDYKETAWYLNGKQEYYVEQNILYNATATFSLITNMDKLTMQFSDQSYTFTREDINHLYEKKDLASRLNTLKNKFDDNDYLEKTITSFKTMQTN